MTKNLLLQDFLEIIKTSNLSTWQQADLCDLMHYEWFPIVMDEKIYDQNIYWVYRVHPSTVQHLLIVIQKLMQFAIAHLPKPSKDYNL